MRLIPTLPHASVVSTRAVAISLLLLMNLGGAAQADAVLLEFSSPNCPPCRAMEPIVSELIARGVPVRQVDVQAEPQLMQRYNIRSTPTYVVLNEGREVTRLIGAQTAAQLQAALQQSPSGPLVPTRSQVGGVPRPSSAIGQPQTRLAPMAGAAQAGNADAPGSATRSVRREQEDSGWQSLTSANPSTDPASLRRGEPSRDIAAEAMPSVTLADAVERAHAATVRLRVYDGRGYGAGTGTIIDVHGEEALVLTCGHLFRDGEGKDKIEVDIFVGGEPRTVAGQLIDFDAGDRDIGLVAIRPGFQVQPVEVVAANDKMKVGQVAFSFGCDRGDPPSRRDTRITGVNKYNQNIGGSNLEISGAPIDGRSGGGLFDERGVLVGVCNAADYKSDIGIYTGPGSIHWQLDRVQLSRLYQGQAAESFAHNDSASPGMSGAAEAVSPSPALNQFAMNTPSEATSNEAGTTEMIVILRDRNGDTREQVITLDHPDAQLVQQIRQAARR